MLPDCQTETLFYNILFVVKDEVEFWTVLSKIMNEIQAPIKEEIFKGYFYVPEDWSDHYGTSRFQVLKYPDIHTISRYVTEHEIMRKLGFMKFDSYLSKAKDTIDKFDDNGDKAGALLGKKGEALLNRIVGNALATLDIMFQPGKAIAAISTYTYDQLVPVVTKMLEQQRVKAVSLEKQDPARAPPIRAKLEEYLAASKEMYKDNPEVQSINLDKISINILTQTEIPKQIKPDPDLERLGVFHLDGKIYNTESVFNRVTDDKEFAAIQLHEALESAGIEHKLAVKIVHEVTGYTNKYLIKQAGLKQDILQRILPTKSPNHSTTRNKLRAAPSFHSLRLIYSP
jgi:hypothetical protein